MKVGGVEYSDELCRRVEEYYESYAGELGYMEFADEYRRVQLENRLPKYVVEVVKSRLKLPRHARILDVGCGLGGLVSEFKRAGYSCYGVDPDAAAVAIAVERLTAEGIDKHDELCVASGEHLPFERDHFDLVCSITVIEHVSNAHAYLEEIMRVLKPGGVLVVVAPNFLSFWEGHYRLYVPPYMMHSARKLFKIYVRMFGRNPAYADKLNFKITPRFLCRELELVGFTEIEDISLAKMTNVFSHPDKLADSSMRRMVSRIRNNAVLRMACSFSIRVLGLMKCYHPIVILARRSTQ